MERFYRLDPEVPGGFGEGTVIDTDRVPWKVDRLHLAFDGWLGDDLVTSHPVFAVTQDTADRLLRAGATGFELREMDASKSPTFEDLYPGRSLPAFRWLDVTGVPGRDDFGIAPPGDLVVSDRALDLLREGRLDHCDVEEARPGG